MLVPRYKSQQIEAAQYLVRSMIENNHCHRHGITMELNRIVQVKKEVAKKQ